MRLRKALFVLPNLFTVSSIFCGLYALSLAASDREGAFYQAAIAILFAVIFDAVDGRVARLTKTQSEFGMQLDSLADVVSFGAAPALLLYRWALAPLGFPGLFVAFLFVACGALRLARFNVLANRRPTPGFFVGLPIPAAAGVVVALVLSHGVAGGAPPAWPVAMLALVVSALMVSNVRYRTFKTVRLTRRRTALLFLAMGAVIVSAAEFQPAVVVAALIMAYVASGLAEGVVVFGRRRVERRRARIALTALGDETVESDEDDEDDDDFA